MTQDAKISKIEPAPENNKHSVLTSKTKPPRTAVNPDNIPEEMRNEQRWLCWKWEWRGKKWDKPPLRTNGKYGSSTDPLAWASFGVAYDAYQSNSTFDGIGFVLGDNWTGVDVDDCRNPDDSTISVKAESIIQSFDSYTEISPSGTGVKIFIHGIKPTGSCANHEEGIEVYSSGRYFTVTGYHVEETPNQVASDNGSLEWLQRSYLDNLRDVDLSKAEQKTQLTDLELARQAIAHIPSKYASAHRDWIRVALAAKNTSEELRDDWVAWSRGGDGFVDDEDCVKKWKKIKPSGKLGVGTLVHLAQESGWRPERPEAEKGGFSQAVGDNPQNSRDLGGYRRKPSEETPETAIPELLMFTPFPTESLPRPLAELIRQAGAAICCDESFVALPSIAALASAIGNSQVLRIKRDWRVPAIVWTSVVAESGTVKSAPLRFALRPIHKRQKRLLRDFDKEHVEYEKQNEIYQRDLAEFKKSKKLNGDPPTKPELPVCARVVVDDSTIEALGKRLKDNPRGVLCAKDELSGWFGSFNRYNKGTGDESKWLEFFNGQTAIIDRSSSQRPLVIDKAAVSITGTIQPAILRKQLTSDHRASGLAARLLFAMPPKRMKKWTEYEVSESVEDEVNEIFDYLFSLEMRIDEEDNLQPNNIVLHGSAKAVFISYFNRHNQEQQQLSGDIFAAYSKLEEYAARFALIIHCVECAIDRTKPLGVLDVNSMTAGIQLCEWFKSEAKRVYTVLAESDVVADNRQLLVWCSAQTDPVTPYQLYRQHRSLGDSEGAEKLISKFVESGYGEWVDIPPTAAGGKPSRGFRCRSYGDNPNIPLETVRLSPNARSEDSVLGEPWQGLATAERI